MAQEIEHPSPAFIEKARRLLLNKMEAERKRIEQYGQVHPIAAIQNFGQTLVAVGGKIYGIDPKLYFADFLRMHVEEVFGRDWWIKEATKSQADRHLVASGLLKVTVT
ncbi:MAG: hypothetical protein WAL56_10125 [Candidatus Sulfotelmatobacter sp.]